MQLGKFIGASVENALAAVVGKALHRFGQRRQRSLAVAGDVEIDIPPAAEVLIIGLQVEIAQAATW
jgi:hypothetical protein